MNVSEYSSEFDVHGQISWTKFGLKVELQGRDVFGTSFVSPPFPFTYFRPLNEVRVCPPLALSFYRGPFIVVKKKNSSEDG